MRILHDSGSGPECEMEMIPAHAQLLCVERTSASI